MSALEDDERLCARKSLARTTTLGSEAVIGDDNSSAQRLVSVSRPAPACFFGASHTGDTSALLASCNRLSSAT
jgi:hypothetical protein